MDTSDAEQVFLVVVNDRVCGVHRAEFEDGGIPTGFCGVEVGDLMVDIGSWGCDYLDGGGGERG